MSCFGWSRSSAPPFLAWPTCSRAGNSDPRVLREIVSNWLLLLLLLPALELVERTSWSSFQLDEAKPCHQQKRSEAKDELGAARITTTLSCRLRTSCSFTSFNFHPVRGAGRGGS
eukprot:757007-Hanusia_phi.AAC.1